MRTEVYWIEGPWPGRLAIMPRPRGGDWLEEEMDSWKRIGIGTVVSALTAEEMSELELTHEQELSENAGIRFVSFPIVDRSVPVSEMETLTLVRELEQRLAQGENIAIHCRQGVGRAALLAACILAVGGIDPPTAFVRITAVRGCGVPETSEQREWIVRFVRNALVSLSRAEQSE